MLLDRFYITKRRVWTHIILWIIFSTLSGVVLFLLPSGIMQKISLFALAVWLVVFGIVLARRVIIAYRRAIRIFNETQADDIGTYCLLYTSMCIAAHEMKRLNLAHKPMIIGLKANVAEIAATYQAA